jgi:hypothetical protein
MGFRAREVDYGVVEVESAADIDESHLDGYLGIWRRVHARATVEVELASSR